MIARLVTILVLIAIAWSAALAVYAYISTHPRVDVAANNRDSFVHVIALVDASASIPDRNFHSAKKILKQKVLPHIGLGDIVVAYWLGSRFSLNNEILRANFRTLDPPFEEEAREESLRVVAALRDENAPATPDEPVYELVRSLSQYWAPVAETRADLLDAVENFEHPRERDTDIVCALMAVRDEFLSTLDSGVERWLLISSDLIDDPPAGAGCSLEELDRGLFEDVQIVLIYPSDSEQVEGWDRIEEHWRGFFGDIDLQTYNLPAALTAEYLLPPNPLAGLETYRLPTFGETFLELVSVQFPILAGLFLGAGALGFWINRRNRGGTLTGGPTMKP